jgi:hypothetical protein
MGARGRWRGFAIVAVSCGLAACLAFVGPDSVHYRGADASADGPSLNDAGASDAPPDAGGVDALAAFRLPCDVDRATCVDGDWCCPDPTGKTFQTCLATCQSPYHQECNDLVDCRATRGPQFFCCGFVNGANLDQVYCEPRCQGGKVQVCDPLSGVQECPSGKTCFYPRVWNAAGYAYCN